MDDFRPCFRAATGGDRRLEIVSGKGFGSQQMYSTGKPRSPDTVAAPPRQNQVASSSSSKTWGFSDPEMKRKKRIVRYKVYSIEGKFKASIKNGFRWIKNKCSELIHGY